MITKSNFMRSMMMKKIHSVYGDRSSFAWTSKGYIFRIKKLYGTHYKVMKTIHTYEQNKTDAMEKIYTMAQRAGCVPALAPQGFPAAKEVGFYRDV